MTGGMPEAVIASADFINEFDKEVNYMRHIYWLKRHEWFLRSQNQKRGRVIFLVVLLLHFILYSKTCSMLIGLSQGSRVEREFDLKKEEMFLLVNQPK